MKSSAKPIVRRNYMYGDISCWIKSILFLLIHWVYLMSLPSPYWDTWITRSIHKFVYLFWNTKQTLHWRRLELSGAYYFCPHIFDRCFVNSAIIWGTGKAHKDECHLASGKSNVWILNWTILSSYFSGNLIQDAQSWRSKTDILAYRIYRPLKQNGFSY